MGYEVLIKNLCLTKHQILEKTKDFQQKYQKYRTYIQNQKILFKKLA